MAKVVLTWQLGGGSGHAVRLLPFARALLEKGHSVTVALRDLAGTASIFRGLPVKLVQAPFRTNPAPLYPVTTGYVHMLANGGFGTDNDLAALFAGWRTLFELIGPDAIVADHSPHALLAARAMGIRTAIVGSGFFAPPDSDPLPVILPNAKVQNSVLQADEAIVRDRINVVLRDSGAAPLERLAQLYAGVEETLLLTWPELDHFGARRNVRYWGPITASGGAAPQWPSASGAKKIYGYLKPFPALTQLLTALQQTGHSVLIVSDGISAEICQQFSVGSMRITAERLDLAQVGKECDLAVMNANHGTLCDILRAGKPLFLVPLFPEQGLLADAVRRVGAAEGAPPVGVTSAQYGASLGRLLSNDAFARAAAEFSRRYADFDREQQRVELAASINEFVGR